MTKRQIIVIAGKQFSGKDVVAGIILDILPDFKHVALSRAIKTEFEEQKNITLKEIERNKHLYRAELIELGNKRRAEDPDYWIKKVLAEKGNIIISDLRLKYELKTFKKLNAISIRIESSREERAKRGHIVQENDLTETELDIVTNWDFIIENNGDLEALEKDVKKVAQSIREIPAFCCK